MLKETQMQWKWAQMLKQTQMQWKWARPETQNTLASRLPMPVKQHHQIHPQHSMAVV
jgi:hypothetical protein